VIPTGGCEFPLGLEAMSQYPPEVAMRNAFRLERDRCVQFLTLWGRPAIFFRRHVLESSRLL